MPSATRSIALACAVLLVTNGAGALSLHSLEGVVLGRIQTPQRYYDSTVSNPGSPVVTVAVTDQFILEGALYAVAGDGEGTLMRWRELAGKRALYEGRFQRCPERRTRDPTT